MISTYRVGIENDAFDDTGISTGMHQIHDASGSFNCTDVVVVLAAEVLS
jgi:hypothetical protein